MVFFLLFLGFADDIKLSGSMSRLLRLERLDSVICSEVQENAHVIDVCSRVDYVANVSIQHEINVVEPFLALPALHSTLALPPPLAPNVLMSFKKWYYNRIPLRMTHQQNQWNTLEDMLTPNTVNRNQQ